MVASSLALADVAIDRDPVEAEWDAYVLAHPLGTANHLWKWRHVYDAAFRHRTVYVAARRGGGITGVLPLVIFANRAFGRFAVSLPFVNYGGILADDDATADALLTEARRLALVFELSHVELRHRAVRFPQLPCRRHKAAMLMPLRATADDAWNAFDRKVRNQIRKAEKSGLVARVGGAELLGAFYGVFAETMRDLGTPVYPRRFFDEVFRSFADRCHTVIVEHEGRTVAAAVLYAHQRAIEIPSAGTRRDYRSLCAGNLLYWTIVRHAIALGFETLDFGRSTPGEGTFQFKTQWGAVPHPLHWEYALTGTRTLPDRSPSNPRFRAAIEAWKRLPVPVANVLGPHVVRYLP
jgi:FemAB-related protein (PEP-CTERM system-associated)